MATGTKSGLLEDGDRHAQSVFKHQVLRHYLKMFMAMTGSTAEGKRVVVLDGFAGRGRYVDGRPASGELILQAISDLKPSRQVAAFFVEKGRADYGVLADVVAEYAARGLDAQALPGLVEDHLDQVVAKAEGVPLFLFLDPCGAGVSYERLVELLTGPRARKRPQTEVLLNFSADMSRRIAGALARGRTDQRAMDTACGGEWWRRVAEQARQTSPDDTFEPVVHAVAAEYARRVGAACRMMPVTIPVYRKLGHQPIYHLVFFTRSQYGLWVFGDAVGAARKEWLRHQGRMRDAEAGQTLWPHLQDMEERIEQEATRALDHATANLRRQLATGRPFQLVHRPRELFGMGYGIATEATIIRAMRDLHDAGELEILSSGARPRDTVVRAVRPGG
ncbi:three-Cys-motif partner protein TcmP [Actinomadura madurae]|uniref:three-Cys-motif partner protein TcmP n=1 Tax=Actinomadura madurae TaxID=1993 RepID=UPI002025BDC6|nr:three-Cys-motif partner protein TcmP [Actinomadura madurae]URN01238.1 three-Cys-motif partner protein TcmP [Actinomadura madurae]